MELDGESVTAHRSSSVLASTAAGRGPRLLARVEGRKQTSPSRRW
jgi:hypothetical protein